MRPRLLDLIACPVCGGTLHRRDVTLTCDSGHTYPIVNGIPRLVPGTRSDDGDAASAMDQVRRRFEFQWRTWGTEERLFGQTDEDMANRLVGPYTRGLVTPESYRGRLVLDAGCGHGRYLCAFAGFGAEVVGMDYGNGVDAAAARIGGHPGIHLVQGDVTRPPFRAGSFDVVFSFGVLQFTPSTRAAFMKLAHLVKPGGLFYIWVYPEGGVLWEVSQRAIRALTTRLPDWALYALCFVPVPLLSIVRTYSGTSLRNSSWRQCAQVVWDWYSPQYQWHHTRDEVREWYEAAGFEPPVWLDVQIGAIGRKRDHQAGA